MNLNQLLKDLKGLRNLMKLTLVSVVIVLISGCAVNRNLPMQDAFWQNKNQKIVVAAVLAPEPKVHQYGQQGLVDMAITGIANKDLSAAVKKTDLSWYNEIPQSFARRLKDNRMQASVYSRTLDLNKKKHANVLAETDGDLLLTFELKAVGARREYAAGFIPNGGPEGYCVLIGELFDPKQKKVLWRHETEIIQKVDGQWDQPPHFPNFNNALNIAIRDAQQELLDSFFSGR